MRQVRKFRRRHGDVDDWLMTYADMITLLLCFFAVFLSVSVPKKDMFEKARDEVMHQFGPSDDLEGRFPAQTAIRRFSEEEENMGYNAMPSIVDEYESKRGSEGSFKKRGGDRIVTMEMNSAAFFASGSATLSEEGKNILLGVLTNTIRSEKYRDYVVTVEGHTDDNPISTPQFPSNWELSTARASAVVKYFLEQGLSPSRLRASGYADTFPKVANRDDSGEPIPANQAQNRRVIIKLERIEKEN